MRTSNRWRALLPALLLGFNALGELVVVNGLLLIPSLTNPALRTAAASGLMMLGSGVLGLTVFALDRRFHLWRVYGLMALWGLGSGLSPLIPFVLMPLLLNHWRQRAAAVLSTLIVLAAMIITTIGVVFRPFPGDENLPAITLSPLAGITAGLLCGVVFILAHGVGGLLGESETEEERRERERTAHAPLAGEVRPLAGGVLIGDDGEVLMPRQQDRDDTARS